MIKYAAPLCLLLAACSDKPPTTPETRPVENPNAGNTAIYDVDPDDPYEIDQSVFLDLRPGAPVSGSRYLIDAGLQEEGSGEGHLYYIHGDRDDTLGYLLLEPGTEVIGDVHVNSPDVVTADGLRVGLTYADLVERLGELTITEGRDGSGPLATKDGLGYRFELSAGTPGGILEEATVTEILLLR